MSGSIIELSESPYPLLVGGVYQILYKLPQNEEGGSIVEWSWDNGNTWDEHLGDDYELDSYNIRKSVD